jgi:CRP-like cAMP-binding protein
MITPELIRRYPFFAGLSEDQIRTIGKLADEEIVETGHYFFHEDDHLDRFYLALEGAIALVIELPDRAVEHRISDQFTRKLSTTDVVISTVGPGDVFGWSGLVPPHSAIAGAKALAPARVIKIDCEALLKIFEEDYSFGYRMTQKAAQGIRERLHDLRIESLASTTP